MLQKLKDLLLYACLGFISLFFLFFSILGGESAISLGIIALILFALIACGASALKNPNYMHFVNLIAFLSPIAYVLSDMKIGLPILIAGIIAFLLGGGLRFIFTAISFYKSSTKKNS
jgi:hypothetical protein